MRSKHLTAESGMRGIAYAIGIHAQDVAQSFIEHGIKVQIISPNKKLGMLDNSWAVEPRIRDLVFPLIEPKEKLGMLDNSWAVEPRIRDLVFPLIEPKENHPYGWYRKFEKKKR